jgi:hypothetical protein
VVPVHELGLPLLQRRKLGKSELELLRAGPGEAARVHAAARRVSDAEAYSDAVVAADAAPDAAPDAHAQRSADAPADATAVADAYFEADAPPDGAPFSRTDRRARQTYCATRLQPDSEAYLDADAAADGLPEPSAVAPTDAEAYVQTDGRRADDVRVRERRLDGGQRRRHVHRLV